MMGSSGSGWRADGVLYGGGAGVSLDCVILTGRLGWTVSAWSVDGWVYGRGNVGRREDPGHGDAVMYHNIMGGVRAGL